MHSVMPSPQNQLRAPKLTERQTNLKQKHKSLFYPISLQRMQTTRGSVIQFLAHLLPQTQLPALLHGASWDGFAFPSLCYPTWPCLTLQPLCSSLKAFHPGALNTSHILPCTLVSLPLLPGAKLFPADRGRPHWKHGKHHSWGLFTRWAKQNPDTAK